jgi:hypothetical protein
LSKTSNFKAEDRLTGCQDSSEASSNLTLTIKCPFYVVFSPGEAPLSLTLSLKCDTLTHESCQVCHFVSLGRSRKPSSPPAQAPGHEGSDHIFGQFCVQTFLVSCLLSTIYLDFGLLGVVGGFPYRGVCARTPEGCDPTPGSLPPLTGSHTGGYVRNFYRKLSEKVSSFCDNNPTPGFLQNLGGVGPKEGFSEFLENPLLLFYSFLLLF